MQLKDSGERQPISARPIGHRDVVAIALPIMLSNATVPLIGFVDTVVVGQLGQAHLIGAVAVGATIFNFLYWGFGFLRMGAGRAGHRRGRSQSVPGAAHCDHRRSRDDRGASGHRVGCISDHGGLGLS